MEPHHDEEIENAVLKDRSHQPIHTRLPVVSFELQYEDDNGKEGNQVCKDVRFLGICERVRNRYRRTQPVTCRPTRQY